MTTATDNKVALVMRELLARRLRGEIAADAKISTEQMARIASEIGQPVSAITFMRIERRALAKLTLAIFHAIENHPELSEVIGSDDSTETQN